MSGDKGFYPAVLVEVSDLVVDSAKRPNTARLVRYLARHGVKVGPMLHFESGVSQIWRKAGLLTSDFNGHSLQIRAITMALQRGLRT